MNAVVYNRHFDFNDLAKFCKKKKNNKNYLILYQNVQKYAALYLINFSFDGLNSRQKEAIF